MIAEVSTTISSVAHLSRSQLSRQQFEHQEPTGFGTRLPDQALNVAESGPDAHPRVLLVLPRLRLP